MKNLRYVTFDATQALIIVSVGIAIIVGLHAFESWADRHVRERTRRALQKLAEQDANRERARDHDSKVT